MKHRADVRLLESGLASSRTRAQALILAGQVFEGERRVEKPGELVSADAVLTVRQGPRFVSRGGEKLDAALDTLKQDVTGAVAVDVGASTGGFTDCLLKRGAARVYAVDVGRGQLAQSLRNDSRVIVMERTNARHLDASAFPERIDLVVVDASFIGLEKLTPAIASFLAPGGRLIALVKPQFEAGRDAARRGKGVIKDPLIRDAAIASARDAVVAAGFEVLDECDSAVPGPKGNVEHFLLGERQTVPK